MEVLLSTGPTQSSLNTMGSPIFEPPFLRRNAPKKIKISNYIGLCVKTTFRNNLGPREVLKLENLYFHFHAFSGWGTSGSPKLFLKAVFTQSPI